jgi:hypothetical protein
MKYVLLALLAIGATASAADRAVNGYTRSNGTYVQPYERTAPNNTRADNYSTQGNTNPYTGQQGTKPLEPNYNSFQQPSQSNRGQNGFNPYSQ